MATVKIHPGICGLDTTVTATVDDDENLQLSIESKCSSYTKLADALRDIDAFTECFAKVGEGEVYKACRKTCRHTACPVPAGIVKAIEVAAGLALPKDVSMEITV